MREQSRKSKRILNQRGNKAYENKIRISIETWKDIGTKSKSKMDVFKKDIENKSQTEKNHMGKKNLRHKKVNDYTEKIVRSGY